MARSAAGAQRRALDLSGVAGIEYTAYRMLIEADQELAGRGIALWLVALTPSVLQRIAGTELGRQLGPDRMLASLQDAVAAFQRNGPVPAPAPVQGR